jgi:glucokinase
VDASTATTEPPAGDIGPTGVDGLPSAGAGPSPSTGPSASPALSPPLLAVDVGGTKMEAGIVTRDGRILDRSRIATPGSTDPDKVFDALATVVTDVLDRSAVAPTACGVGCGGPMELGGRSVSPLNIPAWRGFPLRARLAELVGVPVAVDNDAKALALGEGWVGAARGWDDYLAMVVSTGIGGGIVLDGRLLDGANGNAGHIGHVVVEPRGRPCACGGRGCLEAEVSGTAIAAMTGRPAADADLGLRRHCGTLVGRAVASVACLLDLQLAVVAGSVALGFGDDFFDAANDELALRCGLEFSRTTRIEPGGLVGDGPLVGAAAVALRRHARTDAGPWGRSRREGPGGHVEDDRAMGDDGR